MMKTMSKEAGLKGNFTNHSLRAYSASEVFQNGVPEKLIKDRTGHRSLEALWKYENASEMQVVKVSHSLASSDGDALKKVCAQPQVSQSASSFSAFSLSGCSFQSCTVNFVARPSSAQQYQDGADV